MCSSDLPVVEFARNGLRYRFECPLSLVGRRLESSSLRARIRSPKMRALYDVWRRDGATMPAFGDIRGEIEELGENVTLVEFDGSTQPAAMRFIAVSRHLEGNGRRFDVTLGEGGGRDVPGTIEATYRRCARMRQPMYEFSTLGAGGRNEPILERLFLPCSSDGRNVTHLLSMSIFND